MSFVPLKSTFHKHKYHYFLPQDEIGYNHLEKIKDKQYRNRIFTIFKDVNFLLRLKEEDFWTHIKLQGQSLQQQTQQDELKGNLLLFLQSCLSTFSKKVYMPYQQHQDKEFEEYLSTFPESWINIWFQLKKTVFFVFYRISSASKQEYKDLMYNHWLLDNIKVFDICLIYGPNNKKAVEQLIKNMYKCSPQVYNADFQQVLNFTELKLEIICGQLQKCDYDVQNFLKMERQDERYHHPFEALYQVSAGFMFQICDLLWNLETIFEYFPGKCKKMLAENAIIHKRLIMIYFKLKEKMKRKWKLGSLQTRLENFTSIISIRIATFLTTSLQLIHGYFQNVSPSIERAKLSPLKRTFINICHFTLYSPSLFQLDRSNKELQNIYLTYAQTLCSQMLIINRKKSIFNVEPTIRLFDKNHENYKIIEKVIEYETKLKTNIEKLSKIEQELKQSLSLKKEQMKQRQEMNKKLDKIEIDDDQPQFLDEAYVYWTEQELDDFEVEQIQVINERVIERVMRKKRERMKVTKAKKKLQQLQISIIQPDNEPVLEEESINLLESEQQSSGLTETIFTNTISLTQSNDTHH